jgi:hypothetical protein
MVDLTKSERVMIEMSVRGGMYYAIGTEGTKVSAHTVSTYQYGCHCGSP